MVTNSFQKLQWFVSEGLQWFSEGLQELYCVDDPDSVKKGGVCVYYKETLAVHFLQTKLGQHIVSEITFENERKGLVISFYRSPSQIQDKFDNFFQSFEELLQDVFKLKKSFVLITDTFNCRNPDWHLGNPVTPHGVWLKL